MKKFLTISLMILAMFFFVSCAADEDDFADTGDTASNNHGENGDDNSSGDTGNNNDPADSGDTGNNNDPADSTDTGNNNDPADSGDTGNNNDPADSGDTGNNNDPADSGDTGNDPIPPQQECTGLSIEWDDFAAYPRYSYTWYSGDEPRFFMEFFDNEGYRTAPTAGTHVLDSGNNANYATCNECLTIYSDVVDGSYTKQYFQKSGNLKIDSYSKETNAIKGAVSAKFVEVTIDEETYESTPVAGSKCLEIESGSFECIPQCDGKVCGSNGCGGTCGSCDGKACSEDGQCVPFECEKLTFDEVALGKDGYLSYYFAEVTGDKAGSTSLQDFLEIDFYLHASDGVYYAVELEEGEVTLTNDPNECDQCIFLYEDVDPTSYTAAKFYFQESGTLNFTKVTSGTMKSQGNGSFRLQEVDSSYIPVPGGKCYDVENFTWDTTK